MIPMIILCYVEYIETKGGSYHPEYETFNNITFFNLLFFSPMAKGVFAAIIATESSMDLWKSILTLIARNASLCFFPRIVIDAQK